MLSRDFSIKKMEPPDIVIVNNMGIHNIASSAKVVEEEELPFLLSQRLLQKERILEKVMVNLYLCFIYRGLIYIKLKCESFVKIINNQKVLD
ncbi:hypothetical protein pb186bvf_004500 [Paramecium bursaria]